MSRLRKQVLALLPVNLVNLGGLVSIGLPIGVVSIGVVSMGLFSVGITTMGLFGFGRVNMSLIQLNLSPIHQAQPESQMNPNSHISH